jgi:ATP-dependent DNA helicase RecG
MNDAELEQLLDNIESDRAERTESTNDGDKFRQAVCAFANDLPDHRATGVLFVGVNNKGEPTGIDVSDQLLQNLASIRGDGNVLPFPSLDVQKRMLKGKEVAVVFVYPSSAPPVRFKGTVWIRSGPRRGIANPDDERRLSEKRRSRDLPADVRPIESARLDALDELLFRRTYLPSAVSIEVLDQNQRSLEHQYIALKFAHPGPPLCPTLIGVLAVGKAPTDWFPGAYVQFVRIEGQAIGDPIKDSREVRGPLPDLLSELDDLLKANIQTSVDFTSGPVEVRKPDYPLVALQQIARNAILHRSYKNTYAPVRLNWFDDRVEIQNPGGPFGQVTKQNFGHPGAYDYRNPNLAGVMKELGYVQRFGFGIVTARNELAKNGNSGIEFQVEDSHVAAIIRR